MVYELHFNKTVSSKALWQLWACATLLWDCGKRVKPQWEGGCSPLHWPCDVAEGPRAGLSPARRAAPVACVLTWGSTWMMLRSRWSTDGAQRNEKQFRHHTRQPVWFPGLILKWSVTPLSLLKTVGVGGTLRGSRETMLQIALGTAIKREKLQYAYRCDHNYRWHHFNPKRSVQEYLV